ncbi:hypothetical protein NDU88_000387 [Pleurodeles waltl]|uniref:Uncharacterized protein n=1 Tax=Pleurodeles waltl TaxID=8319 RepID=A0AAV7WL87_PLEWA|nr:hypothetical protein NDU88_000387 [Pleurodeles waltl]
MLRTQRRSIPRGLQVNTPTTIGAEAVATRCPPRPPYLSGNRGLESTRVEARGPLRLPFPLQARKCGHGCSEARLVQLQRPCQASERRRAKHPNLQMGEAVILKDRHPSLKFRTPFEPDVWRVEKVKGTLMTAVRWGRRVTRNVLWFRKVVPGEGIADAGSVDE